MISRRNVLQSSAVVPAVAVGGVSGQLFTCSQTGGVQINPTVFDTIMAEVAKGCNFIPAVSTITALISASFPALVGAATVTDTVLAEIKAIFCANVPTPANPVSSLKLKTGSNVAVAAHGWVIQDGKLVYV